MVFSAQLASGSIWEVEPRLELRPIMQRSQIAGPVLQLAAYGPRVSRCGNRSRNLVVTVVFTGATERLDDGVEDGHRQNQGKPVTFSQTCCGRAQRQTM